MTNLDTVATGLAVVVSSKEKTLVVSATGDVDLFTIAELEPPLMQGLTDLGGESEDEGLTVDLSGVDFIDSCGLALMIKARNSARELGREFKVVLGRNTQPARVMKLGRFESLMSLQYAGE